MSKHKYSNIRVPIEDDNISIVREDSKCVLCGACKTICKFEQGVYGNYDLEKTGDKAICIHCGQCAIACPVKAITEVNDVAKVKRAMQNPENIMVIQTAPSVRVSLGEAFGLEPGSIVEGKIISALRKLGFHYVFDTTFGADLTIMEEAAELVDRIANHKNLPQFTSCCPAWVKYAEIFYPEYLSNLSTTKSPILMQGTMIKTYFAEKMNINPKRIINVALTPCTAKKYEINRPEMNHSGKIIGNEKIKDMDYILTTRELVAFLKQENIDFLNLEDSSYDCIFGRGSGAGVIFGNTGGVMEAAVRTAYYMMTKETPDDDFLQFTPVRGLDDIKEAKINIGNKQLSLAVVHGTRQVNKLFDKMKSENLSYDFIEVMACKGGCIAGGGQPKPKGPMTDDIRLARINSLYYLDQTSKKRNSYENPEIKQLYQEYLIKPLSEKSKVLLHTSYCSKKEQLEVKIHL